METRTEKSYQATVDELIKAANKFRLVCEKDEDDGKAVYQDGGGDHSPFLRVTQGAFCLRMAWQTWINHFEMGQRELQHQLQAGCVPGQPPGFGGPLPPGFAQVAVPAGGLPGFFQTLLEQAPNIREATAERKISIILDLARSLPCDDFEKLISGMTSLTEEKLAQLPKEEAKEESSSGNACGEA